MPRYLIVNADDFGLSAGINRGIIEAAESGILTSASLMVRQPAAGDAGEYAKKNRRISVGLHLDLGEWVYRNGEWVLLYEVVRADDADAVRQEVERQLAEFRRLAGRNPSHLDSHQHVHRNEPVRSIVQELASRLSLPLRECGGQVRHCGDFYGQTGEGEPIPGAISVESLKKILGSLPEGITELGCHPGYADGLDSVYRGERAEEVRVLCDPRVRVALGELNIELCSFDNLPQRANG